MNARETNIMKWEEHYRLQPQIMEYPDDVLVRISHHLFKGRDISTILDYGFGNGANLFHFLSKGYCMSGVEVSGSALDTVSRKLSATKYDADLRMIQEDGTIPFPDETFDAIIAWQVLYYNDWNGFFKARSEIERSLKKGGIFLGTMGAVGDFSHTHSESLGNNLYSSKVPGQEGEILIILDREQLTDCFPSREIHVGHFEYAFGERHGRHWVISYEK